MGGSDRQEATYRGTVVYERSQLSTERDEVLDDREVLGRRSESGRRSRGDRPTQRSEGGRTAEVVSGEAGDEEGQVMSDRVL